MNYYERFKERRNKDGTNAQARLETRRQRNFLSFLKSSPHYTTFEYENETIECVFEPYRQDETRTLMHILCKVNIFFEVGKIVTIENERFMIFWWDTRKNSGYNRYVAIKMTHSFEWEDEFGNKHISEAYLFFQKNNMLKNELRSRSRSATLYLENLKLNFLIMPLEEHLKVGSYLIIETKNIKQYFRVTGYDLVSTPGVNYVSMDPTYERDLTPDPEILPGEEDEGFWLTGGRK